MSAHAAALQQTAAQRHLWERLLASLPTPRQSPPPPPPPAPGAAAAVAPPSALGAPSLGEDAGMSTVGSEGEEVGSEDSLTDSSSDEDEDAGPHTPGGGQASPRPPVHVAKAMQGSSQQALSAGSPGGSSVSTSQPGGSHWAQVMANVCSEYILACQALARKAGGGVSEGAVFTLHASTGAGVIVSAATSPCQAPQHLNSCKGLLMGIGGCWHLAAVELPSLSLGVPVTPLSCAWCRCLPSRVPGGVLMLWPTSRGWTWAVRMSALSGSCPCLWMSA
jgi:hypothetical protein